MLAIIKDMKALLNEFHEYLNKNYKITLKEIIEEYFYDLKYFILDKDEFHNNLCFSDGCYEYINEMYEKLTKIFKDFENSETYKNLSGRKSPKLKPCVFKPLESIFPIHKAQS